jgi:hypothetical protein
MNVNENVKRDANGRWLKGTPSPSPGRPISSRQRISEKLLSDLADVWEERGKDVLMQLALDDPGKLAQIAYGLLPRDIFLHVQQSGSAENAHQRALLRSVLDAIEEHEPNAQPEILEDIREFIRSRNARLIEFKPIASDIES